MGVLDVASTVLLLRYWLSPAEYGIAAIATTLYPMFDLLADGGISAAVVQRDELDDDRLTSAFWVSCATTGVVALGLCGLGPLLAAIQGHPVVSGLLVAYAVKLLLQNAFWIPTALLRRDLRFKTLAKIRTLASIAETAGKLGSAALGAGVWCFVIGQLAKTLVQAVATQIACPFRPRGRFRREDARTMFHFGSRSMASQVLFHLYTNADYQIVSYVFGPSATGLYRAAYELVLEPAKLLSYIVVDVAFPVFSRLRRDGVALRDQLIAFTRHNMIVLAPIVVAMVVLPEDLLTAAYGGSWAGAGTAVRILAAVAALRAMSFLLPPLLDAIGRVDLTLRYTIGAAIVVPLAQLVAAVALGDRLGWTSVAVGWAVAYPVAFAVLVWFALVQVKLSLGRYARAVAEPIGTALLAFAGASVVAPRVEGTWLRIAVIGAVIVAIHGLALGALGAMRSRVPSTS